jgi:transcriptional regulator with XRE-family HTH domain
MVKPGEHKTVQARILEYAEAIGWSFVPHEEMSQNDLARITGIPQSTISAIENDRVNLGVARAKQLAIALKCHPAVLVFPGWNINHEHAA